ncbi:MAG: hypothetical protein AAF611_21870 [Bacteroidota bacterium]
MKHFTHLLVLLICITSCSTNQQQSEFFKKLNEEKDNLSFTFIANASSYFLTLAQEPKESSDCSKIQESDSQKIIHILNEHGLLDGTYCFFEKNVDNADNQKIAEARKFLILIQSSSNDANVFIGVPSIELTQKLLKRIGAEVNYKDCFEKLSAEAAL